MKSVLLLGQSNMAGRGFIGDVPAIVNENVTMLRNGKWQMMCEPINYDRPVAGVGLSASFADAWTRDNLGQKLGLIPCAEGGSSLDDWTIDGVLFRNAVAQAKLALESSELVAILWHQGEADSMNGSSKVYYEKLTIILEALRNQINAKDIPLIVGGMPDFLGKEGFGAYCTESLEVDDALRQYANNNEHTYFVSAKGLKANPDWIHVDAMSLRIFGIRYYEAFNSARDILEPLVDEKERVSFAHERKHTAQERIFLEGMNFVLGKMDYETYVSVCTKINQEEVK